MMGLATVSGVNWGTRMLRPPAMNAALMHTPRPNPWEMARMASLSDSLPQAATIMPSEIKFMLDSSMPLGVPVVPPL